MKPVLFLSLLLFFFNACVSSKKFKEVQLVSMAKDSVILEKQGIIEDQQKSLAALEKSVADLEKEISFQNEKLAWMAADTKEKSGRIDDLKSQVDKLYIENEAFTRKNDELIHSNSVYAGITRNLIVELEVQHLKVMNLTLALNRKDSINVHLVKKAKKEMSDKKYKKALEKLGFVFN